MSTKIPRLKFSTISSATIKLSDDRLSACRIKPIDESESSFVFSDHFLSFNDDFQFQIINMRLSIFNFFQFGVIFENPTNLIKLISDKETCLKNSLHLSKNVLYRQNDENIILSEEYDLDISQLREGDLLGVKLTEAGELYFTHNCVSYRKIADNISKDVWAFVNLNGSCTFISIVSSNNPISISHKEKMLQKITAKNEGGMVNDAGEVYFHNFCGKEVVLTNNNQVATRKNPTNEFRNAVVISRDSLITNEMFRLRIEGLINKWNGSIELGVTFHNPDMFELPTAMNNLRSGTLVLSGNSILTNGHGTRLPYCTKSLDDLKIGDEVGILRKESGNIHFYINDMDMGVAGNIPVDKDLWVIADLYGRTIKVSLLRNNHHSIETETWTCSAMDSTDFNDRLIFHNICGKNIKLNSDQSRATRINDQEFNNGVVFTNRPLKVGDKWTVKLVRCIEQWAGNMEIGVSTKGPEEGEIPSTMTDLTLGWTMMLTSNGVVINGCPLSQYITTIDIENLHSILVSGIPCFMEGNTLSVELLEDNKIQFYMNGADLGLLTLEANEMVYGVLDLYGKAAEVSLCSQNTENDSENSLFSLRSFNSTLNNENVTDIETPLIYQSLLFTEENNDFGRSFSLLQTESGLCDALKNADRSFLRLLSGTEEAIETRNGDNVQPLLFHNIHGRNVILTNGGRTAYRPSPNNEFKNALVMSSRSLEIDELFEISVDKMTDHWSGSLEIGVTLNKPVELDFPGTLSQLNKDCWILSGSCIMNNGITARNDYSLDMDAISVNSKIGLIRRESGMLHFLLNGNDMGAAYFDVPSGIYVILDLYGQCSKVSITSRTGTKITTDQLTNGLLEISNNASPLIRESENKDGVEDALNSCLGLSRLSPFERVMLVFNEKTSGLSEEETFSRRSRRSNLKKATYSASCDEYDSAINLFNGDNIFGDGIRWDDSVGFRAENQKRNCVIQSKQPIKTNVYYEIMFYMSKTQSSNPVSFGFTTEKFSSQRYLADSLFQLSPPNWIFVGQKLFMNTKLYSAHFAPMLSCCQKQLLIGVYLHDDYSLEVFANHARIGTFVSNCNKNLFMLMDLRGWYDTVMPVELLQMIAVDTNLLEQNIQRPHCGYLDEGEFSTENDIRIEDNNVIENEMNNLPEDPDIEDRIMINILKELYELLPLFMISLKGIETCKLIEKMVLSNNDIVLNVKRNIGNGSSNKFVEKMNIRQFLIMELSRRFSYLTDLENLGDSCHERARVLRQQVMIHDIKYDIGEKAIIVPQSCLKMEESHLSRSKSGCQFGLAIINQELKSEKYKSFELQIVDIVCGNQLANVSSKMKMSLGLIMIETKHFSKVEDAFRFLMTIPCPKYINSLSNQINLQLNLLESESPALILIVEDDSVYLNGRQICKKMPFNFGHRSKDQFISFRLRQTETGFVEIYLSIRTNESNSSHLILSQPLLESCIKNSTVFSAISHYLFIPFVWLKNQITISIMTEPSNMCQPSLSLSQTNQREWLEKHYNDELNKEMNQSQVNEINDLDHFQCFSLKRSSVVKMSLCLPETYFKIKSAICFCNNCRAASTGSGNLSTDCCEVFIKGDPAKEFRLPLGWVKYNIRLNREVRYCLSLWHLAYLTVSPLLFHKLLAASDPISVLKFPSNNKNNSHHHQRHSSFISWLQLNTPVSIGDTPCSTDDNSSPIIISPWQPLSGAYLEEDRSIRPCRGSQLKCYDSQMKSHNVAKVALEVRVRPGSYRCVEYKVVLSDSAGGGEKCFVGKEAEGCAVKRSPEFTSSSSSSSRSINQKTVWILNGEANSVLISGLLIRII